MPVTRDTIERLRTCAGMCEDADGTLASVGLDDLRAILELVEKLPVTADGVVVVPGVDSVYDGSPGSCHCWGGATQNPDRTRLLPLDILIYGSDGPVVDGLVPWTMAYSTPEAALAARSATGQRDEKGGE